MPSAGSSQVHRLAHPLSPLPQIVHIAEEEVCVWCRERLSNGQNISEVTFTCANACKVTLHQHCRTELASAGALESCWYCERMAFNTAHHSLHRRVAVERSWIGIKLILALHIANMGACVQALATRTICDRPETYNGGSMCATPDEYFVCAALFTLSTFSCAMPLTNRDELPTRHVKLYTCFYVLSAFASLASLFEFSTLYVDVALLVWWPVGQLILWTRYHFIIVENSLREEGIDARIIHGSDGEHQAIALSSNYHVLP